MKLIATSKNKEPLVEMDWIIFNFNLIKESKVFFIRELGDSLEIYIDLLYIRTLKPRSIWQSIFSRVINDFSACKYPIYLLNNKTLNLPHLMDLEFCIYPIDKLSIKDWKTHGI